jgi:hypothetical protein
MKKIMMMLVMATVALTASAQNEVGQLTLQPKIGVNLANLTDTKQNDQKGEFKAGLVVGVEAEYGISEKFSVAAGLLYSMQGCNFGEYKVSAGGETLAGWDKNERNFNYLNIPIVANLYFAKGWAIKAGIQPGFLLSAKYKLDGVGAQESFNEDIKDACKTFDLSIPLGLSYEYQKAVFDLRYNLGVTKVNKDGDNSSKNSVIQFTVGYKFAL